ncbi:MAG: DUF2723 domain-containing protein [Bacteroidales bacterium]|nr:DUF2723 domain-containing protein [Bacteroidales bacterium]
MKQYNKLNTLIGWGVWLIATVVYLLTVEPTASWWDCGEYIATAYKLQVGHPPGAPFFQLVGRIFSLFAFGDVSKVALMINVMSALSSSFTILFLFWTITILARKAALLGGEMNTGRMIAIFGSGIVGALAYTFSDTFWFSAEEGEVYAMSSFFTAFVFWAILKWDEVADQQHSARWLVLIAYMVGLSVGVHMLNLLAIPAITFVVYFRKYKPTTKGMLVAGGISLIVLSFIMYGIIPEIVSLFAHSELIFVNTLGLPFNSGTIFLALLLIALIVFAIKATNSVNVRDAKIAIGLAGLLFLLILLESRGAGSFFLRLLVGGGAAFLIYYFRKQKALLNTAVLSIAFILIGYSTFLLIVIRANTNTPINENAPKDAVSLLSYLNREQYGDWPIFHGQYYNSPVSGSEDGSPVYIRSDKAKKYVVADSREGTVPVYDPEFTTIFPRMWSSSKETHIREYKEWGKIKGVPIPHTNREGKVETIMKPTFGENLTYFFRYQVGFMYFRYFMWNYSGRQNDIQGHGGIENGNWITGIEAIDGKRLGSQDNLPATRQSRANNKLYMLPLLLGLAGLFFQLNRDYRNTIVVGLLFLMTGIAIVVYLNQHPYQPRERDYAYAGSTYAFAIWIGLGVLAIYNLLRKALKPQLSAIIATVLTLVLVPGIMASEEWDDHDRSGKYAARDFAINYLESCEPNAILFTNGDNDTFPLWYVQEVEGIRTDVRVVNFMLASGEWYIHQMMRKIYDSEKLPFTLKAEDYEKGTNNFVPVIEKLKGAVELKQVINFIASARADTQIPYGDGTFINYAPTRNFKLTVDSAYLVNNKLIPEDMYSRIEPEITWKVKGQNYLYKNDLMLLDFIASNNWERPIYFTSPAAIENVLNVDEYCHLEGIVYRFLPVKADHMYKGLGGIDTDQAYDLLVNKAKWGNLNDPKVYLDPESRRNSIMPMQNYLRLAQALIAEGMNDSAVAALDTMQKFFPDSKFHYDLYTLSLVQNYYDAGALEKGNAAADLFIDNYAGDLEYYASLAPSFKQYYRQETEQAFMVLQRMAMLAREYKQTEQATKTEQILNELLEKF